MDLNAKIEMIIVHITLPLFLFQAVNSEIPNFSNVLKDVLNEVETDGPEYYGNISLLSKLSSIEELIQYNAQMELKVEKLQFGNLMFGTMNEISELNLNITKQATKMLGDIEQLRYSVMKFLKKENELLNEDNSEKNTDFEHLYRLHVSELLKEEYVTFVAKLQTLKFEIYRMDKNSLSRLDTIESFKDLLSNIAHNEDIPEIPLNEANDEDLPKFDIDTQIDELERLQRLALLIKDQLDEMPKPKNNNQDDAMDSEKTELSEKPQVPRWLLTESDIEEIRTKYIFWMGMFENAENEKIETLRETIEQKGYTIKLFCKTMADYFNVTTIMLECASKEDNECEEMIMNIFNEERFKKFQELFMELVDLNIFPSQ